MPQKILIALGGNALLTSKEKGTAEQQLAHVHESCRHLVEIVKAGHSIAITHGNGPQVGDILLKNEMARDKFPPMPLDICGAETQGMIGYMIQRSMDNRLKSCGMNIPVVTVFTQAMVDADDPAFKNPTKPIGPYYTAKQAQLLQKDEGWHMVEEPAKGYRRVVPSPEPQAIIEQNSIKKLFDEGAIVIACGGGGVPVIQRKDGTLQGVEAVIDKDHTAAVFAKTIGADVLLILTAVDHVAINYGRPDQKDLDKISIEQTKKYLAQGQFPKGNMGPKIESAARFVEGGGGKAIIASLAQAKDALDGRSGTTICSS